ncbi:MAG: hypothetical protein ACYTEX_24935 [Planctomycetota bacterium]|jgi:hypothetical protein
MMTNSTFCHGFSVRYLSFAARAAPNSLAGAVFGYDRDALDGLIYRHIGVFAATEVLDFGTGLV